MKLLENKDIKNVKLKFVVRTELLEYILERINVEEVKDIVDIEVSKWITDIYRLLRQEIFREGKAIAMSLDILINLTFKLDNELDIYMEFEDIISVVEKEYGIMIVEKRQELMTLMKQVRDEISILNPVLDNYSITFPIELKHGIDSSRRQIWIVRLGCV